MNQDVPCPPLGFEKTQLLFSLVTAAGCFGEGSRLAASSPSTSASLGDSPRTRELQPLSMRSILLRSGENGT